MLGATLGGSSALRGSCPPPPALEVHLSLQFLRKAGAQAQEQSHKSASAPGFSAADSQPQELGHRSARNGSAGAVSSEQGGGSARALHPRARFWGLLVAGAGGRKPPAAPKAGEGVGCWPPARRRTQSPAAGGPCPGTAPARYFYPRHLPCLKPPAFFFPFFFHGPPLSHPGLGVTAIAARPAATA